MTGSDPSATTIRAAAVDIGSTSVHLLVADVTYERAPDAVTSLFDTSELLGMGARIETDGLLGSAGRGLLTKTLARYAGEAQTLGATRIAFVGTDPLRHAADAPRACAEIERATGVPIHVLDQYEEAALTLIGVTGSGGLERSLAIVDVGGGSTEIIVAGPDGIREVVGLRIGASRLTALIEPGDPPTETEIGALRAEARRIMASDLELRIEEAIAVGGSAYGLGRVASGPGASELVIDQDRLRLVFELIARERSAALAEQFGLNPRRARILPAGAAIVEAVMDRFGISRIIASDLGIREGLAIALARNGAAWRDRLARQSRPRGWQSPGRARA